MRPQAFAPFAPFAPSVMVRAGTADETRKAFDVGAQDGK
jgi:hypothetical protein